MWVPYTDTIVVVVSDVAEPGAEVRAAVGPQTGYMAASMN